jgi:hypothetical protein
MHDQNQSDELEHQRLRAMLLEDTDSPEEVDALADVVAQLRRWQSPQAETQATAQLIQKLLPEMATGRISFLSRVSRGVGEWWPLLLIRAQLRVVRREIWAASALVMALGTLVTLLSYTSSSTGLTPISIFAPLVAAVGIAFLYDTEVESMIEIENSTPASTRLLLLTRLTLVFGFDLVLGLVGSGLLAIFHADVLVWPLVLSWLAPMAFLSAMAFLLSILVGDALVGSLVGLLVWGSHVFMRSMPGVGLSSILSLPGLGLPEYQPALLSIAALLVCVALWIAGREDRITQVSG